MLGGFFTRKQFQVACGQQKEDEHHDRIEIHVLAQTHHCEQAAGKGYYYAQAYGDIHAGSFMTQVTPGSTIKGPAAVEKYGQMFSSHPVGSGPFRLASRDDTRAVLVKNHDFRKEPFDLEDEGYDPLSQADLGLQALQDKTPPFVDRLELEFITEDAARWNAFSAGELHFIKVPVSQFDNV